MARSTVINVACDKCLYSKFLLYTGVTFVNNSADAKGLAGKMGLWQPGTQNMVVNVKTLVFVFIGVTSVFLVESCHCDRTV
jgi:hypothetical protein